MAAAPLLWRLLLLLFIVVCFCAHMVVLLYTVY